MKKKKIRQLPICREIILVTVVRRGDLIFTASAQMAKKKEMVPIKVAGLEVCIQLFTKERR